MQQGGFCISDCRPKANKSLDCTNSLATFFFDTKGAKKKVRKKRNAEDVFALCGARGGLRALHCASFWGKSNAQAR